MAKKTKRVVARKFADPAVTRSADPKGIPRTARVQRPLNITGVWLRTGGADNRIEVLVELDGVWRLLRGNGEVYRDGAISHIWEPLGIERATVDYLTAEEGSR